MLDTGSAVDCSPQSDSAVPWDPSAGQQTSSALWANTVILCQLCYNRREKSKLNVILNVECGRLLYVVAADWCRVRPAAARGSSAAPRGRQSVGPRPLSRSQSSRAGYSRAAAAAQLTPHPLPLPPGPALHQFPGCSDHRDRWRLPATNIHNFPCTL